jgi:hypothetical protein
MMKWDIEQECFKHKEKSIKFSEEEHKENLSMMFL